MQFTLPLAGTLLAGALSAQATFLVPTTVTDLGGSSTATTNGGNTDSYSFWFSTTTPQPVRIQHLWPTTDIPIAGGALLGMALRRANLPGYGATPPATAALTIDLSVGPNTVAGHSNTLANNRGAAPVTVFNGIVALPADPPGTGPGQFLVVVPFSVPFGYVASSGNTLVADVLISSYSPGGPNTTWTVDAVGIDAGLRTTNHYTSNCRFSNNAWVNSIGHRNPVLGGLWYLSYQGGLPTGLAGIGLLGFRGVGSTWNGILLPLDLGPAGAPGCWLANSIALTTTLTERSAGIYEWPQLPIPSDPVLYDGSFYDQGLFADLAANPLGVVTTWSSKWTVRSGNRPQGGKLYQYVQNGQTFPNVTQGYWTDTATVTQFTY